MPNTVESHRGVGKIQSFANFGQRITLSFGALILALMICILVLSGTYYYKILQREQDKLFAVISNILAASANRVDLAEIDHLRQFIEQTTLNQPTIDYILLVDQEGRILAHSDPRRNDGSLQTDPAAWQAVRSVLHDGKRITRELAIDGLPLREFTVLVSGNTDDGTSIALQIGFSERERAFGLQRGILFLSTMLLILLLIGVAVTRRFAIDFSRPVVELANDLSATLHTIPDLLFELDRQGRYLKIAASDKSLLYAPSDQLIGHTVGEMLPADAADTVLDALANASWRGSDYGRVIRLPLDNGEHWFELSVARKPVDGDGEQRFIVLSRDITERKRAESRLEFIAAHDTLTGLPNRLLLRSSIEQGIARVRRHGKKLVLLMLDLDRFKDVNDSFGHEVGDDLLRQVAKKLTDFVRSSDLVCRLGGDEFTVLLDDIARLEDAERIAQEIIAGFGIPWQLPNGREARIGVSIGIVVAPDQADTPETLLQHADTALYRAKAEGRGRYKYFSDDLTLAARDRIALESRLRQAIVNNELRVHYQPQVDVRTGLIVGAEALVRWQDPEHGLIPPSRFIPLAEETGLIHAIGAWVLRETCIQGARWTKAGLPPLTLAVNVSAHQLRGDELYATITNLLAETGFPAQRLELELTESALLDQRDQGMETLSRLRIHGSRLAIDDFGTGYSSLSYLKRFPLDILKIDKSFVDDIPRHQDDMEIAATIVAIGHILHFKVLAEGVETQEQLEFLRNQGCDYYQGYLFSPPLPADEFAALLEKQQQN